MIQQQAKTGANLPESYIDSYLLHVVAGQSLRDIARRKKCHASTVLRQVRKVEDERERPELDAYLKKREAAFQESRAGAGTKAQSGPLSDFDVEKEARRILRRLSEGGAFLAAAGDLETAAVLRQDQDGQTRQIATTSRAFVERFLALEWITRTRNGRVSRYTITDVGRVALKRLLAQDVQARQKKRGEAITEDKFQEQHRVSVQRVLQEEDGVRQIRVNAAESPLTLLARRKGADGQPFLTRRELEAGERLRSDFEMAHMGPRITQNWDRFGMPSTRGAFHARPDPAPSVDAARDRVNAAIGCLGDGLGDIAMRCCCFLEGLEAAEKRLGWSARSGKVVLKIALQRLAVFYDGPIK